MQGLPCLPRAAAKGGARLDSFGLEGMRENELQNAAGGGRHTALANFLRAMEDEGSSKLDVFLAKLRR